MKFKYIILVLFIIFLIIGIYFASNIIFTEPENNNWTATGNVVANNSSYVLTDSNKPFTTNQYYEVYGGPDHEYLGSYNQYIGGNGSEYYDYTLKFSVNLSDIDWKIDLEDPENTKLNEDVIKQNLTNEIIHANEKGLLSSGYNITIKDGIMSGGYNTSSDEPLNITGNETLEFSFNSWEGDGIHKIEFNVTIPKENIHI